MSDPAAVKLGMTLLALAGLVAAWCGCRLAAWLAEVDRRLARVESRLPEDDGR